MLKNGLLGHGPYQKRRQKTFQGGQRKKDRKIAKTTQNSTFKPLSTVFLPVRKSRGVLPPAADAHGPYPIYCAS